MLYSRNDRHYSVQNLLSYENIPLHQKNLVLKHRNVVISACVKFGCLCMVTSRVPSILFLNGHLVCPSIIWSLQDKGKSCS